MARKNFLPLADGRWRLWQTVRTRASDTASFRPGHAPRLGRTPLRGSPGPAQRAGHSHGRAAMPRKQPVLIHVLTRARAIHGALVATPDRQDTAHPDSGIGASVANQRSRDSESSTRSEEHTSELQSLMRNSYAVFCLKKKKQ